jgi:osmotically-inducible protein OsmY
MSRHRGQYCFLTLQNTLLQARINSALSEHISILTRPTAFRYRCKVTLAGTFSSGNLRDKAENVTQGIAGVREIDNHIISVPSRG